MSDETESDPEVEQLRRARPGQRDLVARQLAARVRNALVDADVAPVRMGRFVVLERLGEGGMGAVYAAFDPKLDRRVALKVMHATEPAARDRVLGEARALAKLTHPHVVAVFDASDEGGELYIAMELVEGTNLRRWLADAKPTRDEVLAIMRDAGRGLAAAHAAGIIHGDIKPENILVGKGVVKVADFGLARQDRELSQTRGGTPGYMAPEQLAGGVANARSDQYAFAVTLHEALTGKRPGEGTRDALPPRLGRAIERALAASPAARFASVDELLAALAPPRSRRWQLAALAATAVAGVAVVVAATRSTDGDACGGGDRRIASALSGAPLAPRAARVVDSQAHAWATMARQTCEATQRGEQSAQLLDLRMACLDRKLDELVAVTTEIRRLPPDAQIKAVLGLSSLEPCADRDHLAGVLPAPAALRPRVDAFYKQLARTSARQKTLDYKAALAEAQQLVAAARELGYPPASADALTLLAKLQNFAGERDAADATLKQAMLVAAEAHDDELLAEVWSTRVFIAAEVGRLSDAIAYAEAAESVAARLAHPERARGAIRSYLGHVYLQQDRLVDARRSLEDAVHQLEQARGPNHPAVGEALTSLADVCQVQGDLAAATTFAQRAVAIFEAAFGRDHQDTALAAAQLGHIAAGAGRLDEALERYQDVLARLLASAGRDHLYTATAHHNVGDTLRKLGRVDEARRELEAARAIFERSGGDTDQSLNTRRALARLESDPVKRIPLLEDLLARQQKLLGPKSRTAIDTINDIGNALRDEGKLAEASKYFERALVGYEEALGPRHARVAIALSNLGEVAIASGKLRAAEQWCERALSIDEQALGKEHPDLAYDLTCLGEARLVRDRAAALVLLERALALRNAGKVGGEDLARTQFALARALPRTAVPRARELATTARGNADQQLARAIERWLAAHQ